MAQQLLVNPRLSCHRSGMSSANKPDSPSVEVSPINELFSIGKHDNLRVIFAGELPIMEYYMDDVAARDHVMVLLSRQGNLTDAEIARGFEVSRSTVT